MLSLKKIKDLKHIRRRIRVRSRIEGTTDRPRLSVYRSLGRVYGQLIDDSCGSTIVATNDTQLPEEMKKIAKKDKAKEVGKLLAKKAKEAGVTKIVFDRSGYKYHGRVQALADGAREGGLEF